jgi:DNA-binding CsgD family transcriptional regulator
MSATGRSDEIRFDEMASALRLAGELRELPRGSVAQQEHALHGLCALVGAQVGLWVRVGFSSGSLVMESAVDRGWSGEAERDTFRRFLHAEQDRVVDPSMAPLVGAMSGPFCTLMREQLVSDDTWYRSDHVQEMRRAARVDSFLYSICIPGDGGMRCISLHRAWGERAFSERERRLVDVFHRECAFLHAPTSGLREVVLQGLAPRLGETLRALARGRSEKQVAADLGLSPHTVHDYVKALYRHFGVQSRGELLARCLAEPRASG